MTKYTFRYKSFYFKVMAETEREAVTRARAAIEETSHISTTPYLEVDLTAGAFEGRIYIETGEISISNIIKKEIFQEEEIGVPF